MLTFYIAGILGPVIIMCTVQVESCILDFSLMPVLHKNSKKSPESQMKILLLLTYINYLFYLKDMETNHKDHNESFAKSVVFFSWPSHKS